MHVRSEGHAPLSMRPLVYLFVVAALCAAPALASPSDTIVSYDGQSSLSIHAINQLVGADRFYNAGYYGGNALIANVEAGHVWNQHEALQNVSLYVNDPSLGAAGGLYDYHATMVGFTLVGLGPYEPGVGYYTYQFGMAPGATLVSTAIATGWVGNTGEFNISTQTMVYGYKTVMQTGVTIPLVPGIDIIRQADVINSSWGYTDVTGQEQETMIIDALAYRNHQTVCLAAGNEGGTSLPSVGGPASGYNNISVAALGTALSNPPYSSPADFSSSGPNDFYNPKTHTTLHGVRCGVSIAAPGTNLFLAAYTGTTGSNPLGTDPYPGATDLYWIDAAGTSFASPIVAGGASLIVDAGYYNFGGGQAVDGRVVKAVLLNSASKNGQWNNRQSLTAGVLTTTQALDYATGAGMLNLRRAYDQYLGGTANVAGLRGGTTSDRGWDFGNVSQGSPNDYFISRRIRAGETFAVTLDWFVNRALDENTNVASDVAFDQLFLQVYLVSEGQLRTLVAESRSLYDNVQHLYFTTPIEGFYGIRVLWNGEVYDLPGNTPNADDYGLAWSVAVPEPALLSLLGIGAIALLRRRGL